MLSSSSFIIFISLMKSGSGWLLSCNMYAMVLTSQRNRAWLWPSTWAQSDKSGIRPSFPLRAFDPSDSSELLSKQSRLAVICLFVCYYITYPFNTTSLDCGRNEQTMGSTSWLQKSGSFIVPIFFSAKLPNLNMIRGSSLIGVFIYIWIVLTP